jgi:hypothetical protein
MTDRIHARATPRFAVTMAAAGCAAIVVGVLGLGGNELGDPGLDGTAAKLPGAALALAVTVGGLLVVRRNPSPALRAAGIVAATLGVPATVLFLTFSEGSFPPFSFDLVLVASTGVWFALYRLGPGRDHAFYLGAALVGAWLAVLELTESVLSFPFRAIGGFFEGFARILEEPVISVPQPRSSIPDIPSLTIPDLPSITIPPITGIDGFGTGRSLDVPDPATIAVLSLLFGAGYLLAMRVLDSRGQVGRATPFAFAGVAATLLGLIALSTEIEEAALGALFVVVGGVVAALGAWVGRRGTTWAGGVGIGAGIVLVAGDLAGDSARTFGACAIVMGIGAVIAAHAIGRSTGEPADDEPGPSFAHYASGGSSQRPEPVEGGGDGLG